MTEVSACPFQHGRKETKTSAVARARAKPKAGTEAIRSFGVARDILRSPNAYQDMEIFREEIVADPLRTPIIFLDGTVHRKRRSQIARFFTPKAIRDRHVQVMQRSIETVLARLRHTGSQQLDLMSMQVACDVAAEIVGLTNSDREAMARRIRLTFASTGFDSSKPVGALLRRLLKMYKAMSFYWLDVKPALRSRRRKPREDVMSFLLTEGYSNKAILTECMTYATAGMLTTREFIVVSAWYLFEDETLRGRFLNDGEETQFAILEEILRLEPVASQLFRRSVEPITTQGRQIAAGEHFTLDLRAANLDEEWVGADPLSVDPERAKKQKIAGAWLSFGDGAHRCPGAQVALEETRLFLDAMLRLPGIRMTKPPTVGWCEPIGAYELHGAIVECRVEP